VIKYIHVRSCFEEFIVRNTMVQSDFNLDTWYSNYDFFYFKKRCTYADVSFFISLHAACAGCFVGHCARLI
jgi:hypothetical protein